MGCLIVLLFCQRCRQSPSSAVFAKVTVITNMTCPVGFTWFSRYGKPAVIDMMDVDMFDTLVLKFDEVQKNLLASIMSKELLKGEK